MKWKRIGQLIDVYAYGLMLFFLTSYTLFVNYVKKRTKISAFDTGILKFLNNDATTLTWAILGKSPIIHSSGYDF